MSIQRVRGVGELVVHWTGGSNPLSLVLALENTLDQHFVHGTATENRTEAKECSDDDCAFMIRAVDAHVVNA